MGTKRNAPIEPGQDNIDVTIHFSDDILDLEPLIYRLWVTPSHLGDNYNLECLILMG